LNLNRSAFVLSAETLRLRSYYRALN
jgi:hypothetical protein